ncbi:unnamed protein product [Didymodactylos carnosus]|uniref:Retrotransposon gag domain-containing protein n=1 Tax=Didymodactylos carnosus TaxID=1234261 RepID=A0A814MUI3_9BILA|nr:unnamed protein product [Didymodactylos carnosus]CAF1369205.1 unnamed protein product [Didymodactylos carnosus]CAF3848721.1 unnamed protein product [Didymodactylos carnosus]CAF4178505.1 unnamed protein product [Didymodactylos carnosus]
MNRILKFNYHSLIAPIVHIPREFIMADQILVNLIAKKSETAPKFSGKLDEDVDVWIRDIVAAFDMAQFEDRQKLQAIPGFAAGQALEWFIENTATFSNWSVFLRLLRAAYSSPAAKQLASQQLRQRKQRNDESINQYFTDVLRLCNLVDPHMTDTSKLDHLQHGLKHSLIKDVLRHAPTTPAEFLHHARSEKMLEQFAANSLSNEPYDHIQSTYRVDKQVTFTPSYNSPSNRYSPGTSTISSPSHQQEPSYDTSPRVSPYSSRRLPLYILIPVFVLTNKFYSLLSM